jgi:AraC family transcriptional regulator of adaptative response/methylated-DNA-[protein]-cysteine methyltransferase
MERRIDYTIPDTTLGKLLVAASERGVCRVAFGASDGELEALLRKELPFAALVRDDVGLKPWSEALVSYVDGHAERLDVPLDVAGSRFRLRVWEALRAIPRGATRSYAEVARSIGAPRGARAVAQACARNPVAIAIPCHRVVGSGGKLGGYAFGLARKRALLAREGAPPTVD